MSCEWPQFQLAFSLLPKILLLLYSTCCFIFYNQVSVLHFLRSLLLDYLIALFKFHRHRRLFSSWISVVGFVCRFFIQIFYGYFPSFFGQSFCLNLLLLQIFFLGLTMLSPEFSYKYTLPCYYSHLILFFLNYGYLIYITCNLALCYYSLSVFNYCCLNTSRILPYQDCILLFCSSSCPLIWCSINTSYYPSPRSK